MKVKRSTERKKHKKGFVGKNTGLSFSMFVTHLLDINESDPPDGIKLTDEDMIETIKDEFGTKIISVRKAADSNSNSSMAALRPRYNIKQPHLISLRYNTEGVPCRNYGAPISITEVRKKCYHYKIFDPRFFTLDEIAQGLLYREEYPLDYGTFKFPTEELVRKFPYGCVNFLSNEPEITLQDLDLLK